MARNTKNALQSVSFSMKLFSGKNTITLSGFHSQENKKRTN